MLLANALVDTFIVHVVFVRHLHEPLSVDAILSRAIEAELLDFGLLVGINAVSSLILGGLLLMRLWKSEVQGAAIAISSLHVVAFLWGTAFRGYPLLVVLAAFNGLMAWRFRRSPGA